MERRFRVCFFVTMPYQSTSDLPSGVKDNLPAHAQEIYLAAFNSALKQYEGDEERAAKVAWAAVKHKYHKNESGKWVKMTEPNFLIPTENFTTSKSMYFPYGKCIYVPGGEFTRTHGEEMVANFKNNILERTDGKLPVNPEHKREMGMLGEIVDLEVGDTGVMATYDWQDETTPKRFKYISPEIRFEWTHPVTGATYKNVTLGAAATNYPKLLGQTAIFSEETQEWEAAEPDTSVVEMARQFVRQIVDSLREYADERESEREKNRAKKDGLGNEEEEMGESEEEFAEQLKVKEAELAAKDAEAAKLAEEKAALETAQAEFAEKLAEKEAEAQVLAEEKAALEAAKAESDAKVQEFSEKAAAEERKRRLAEFAETATELGVPIKAEEFAETLMYFNDADQTEDKAHYERMIAVLKAKGNAAEMAKLFGENGTDAVGASPIGKLDALVAKRMSETEENISTATQNVINEHPELYTEYSESLPKASIRQVEQ